MTTDDRCHCCDRAECNVVALRMRADGLRNVEKRRMRGLIERAERECERNAVDWRARAKATEAEVARLDLLVKEACAVIDEAANETARNGRPISANVLRAHAADIRRHAERGVDDVTEGEETADV